MNPDAGAVALGYERGTVLCVDDDPQLLEGLKLTLGRRHRVLTAHSGAAGLSMLTSSPEVAVVITDMHMPLMDGATFLAHARLFAPDAVRIVLTGNPSLDSTIAAINEGHAFGFLTKPCPPDVMLGAVAAALAQHHRVTAERVLLEETLRGAIRALGDVLAVTHPAAFGHATRIKQLAGELAARLGVRDRWQIDVAAMLSQLGCVSLAPEAAERVYLGDDPSDAEHSLLERMQAVTEHVLGEIPRMEHVRAILGASIAPRRTPSPLPEPDARAAEILRVARDFDMFEARGSSGERAMERMRGRGACYDPVVMEALHLLRGRGGPVTQVREVSLVGLRSGVVLAEDVRNRHGVLIVARGFSLTTAFVERLRSYPPGFIREPLYIVALGTERPRA